MAGAKLGPVGRGAGLDQELQLPEAAVGSFSLDVLARDLVSSRPVIIESRPEMANHDHPGKLLTYAAGYDACATVWPVRDFRDEYLWHNSSVASGDAGDML